MWLELSEKLYFVRKAASEPANIILLGVSIGLSFAASTPLPLLLWIVCEMVYLGCAEHVILRRVPRNVRTSFKAKLRQYFEFRNQVSNNFLRPRNLKPLHNMLEGFLQAGSDKHKHGHLEDMLQRIERTFSSVEEHIANNHHVASTKQYHELIQFMDQQMSEVDAGLKAEKEVATLGIALVLHVDGMDDLHADQESHQSHTEPEEEISIYRA